MTGQLHAAAHALARVAVPPALSEERLLTCERAAAALENRRARGADAASSPADPARIGDRALRRLLRDLWPDPALARHAAPLVAEALARRRRSLDRALIHGWLGHWPVGHPAGAVLRAAAEAAAERHDWPWRERGRRWRLWDGPETLHAALAEAADPAALLRDAGLAGILPGTRRG